MADRPELLDYVVFFETEPEWTDPQGWYYGARFATQRGADRVIVTLAPDEMEFAVEWWQEDRLRLRFASVMVNEWHIETSPGKEVLRVGYNADRMNFCVLQLKPHVQIEWSMTWGR